MLTTSEPRNASEHRQNGSPPPDNPDADPDSGRDTDLGDLLQELRVLLPGTQTLTAFLIILPFNPGFAAVKQQEKWVYVATFLCSVASLVLFTAPAAQHRLQRPLKDRERFKTITSRLMVAGLVPLSIAIVLATQLVLSQVIGSSLLATVAAAIVALLIAIAWWLVPLHSRAFAN